MKEICQEMWQLEHTKDSHQNMTSGGGGERGITLLNPKYPTSVLSGDTITSLLAYYTLAGHSTKIRTNFIIYYVNQKNQN